VDKRKEPQMVMVWWTFFGQLLKTSMLVGESTAHITKIHTKGKIEKDSELR